MYIIKKSLFAFLVLNFLTTAAHSLDVKLEKNVITLSGRMYATFQETNYDFSLIKKLISENPHIKTLNLENFSGGSTTTAGLLYEFISENGLSTTVTGRCASACAWLFLAGRNRSFSDRVVPKLPQIGYHKPLNSFGGIAVSGQDELATWAIRRGTEGRFDPTLLKIYLKFETGKDMIWFKPVANEPNVEVCRTIDNQWACKDWTESKTDAIKSGILTTNSRFHIE
jgi:hypothetical protein